MPDFFKTITFKLIIANLIFFVLTFIPPDFDFLALTPVEAVYGGKLWQFFTYMYVHAGFEHIFYNMFGLLMFGPRIEFEMGRCGSFIAPSIRCSDATQTTRSVKEYKIGSIARQLVVSCLWRE